MAAKQGKSSKERDGLFVKGGRGGPGRPKGGPREREYLNTFRRHVPLEKWGQAVDKLLELALNGNVKAFEALAKYCLPQPAMMLDFGKDTLDAFRVAGMDDDTIKERMAQEVVETFTRHRESEALRN